MTVAVMPERWRPVPGYFSYEVSDQGRVRRAAPGPGTYPGRILKPRLDADGYERLHLYRAGTRRLVRIHRVVAAAWIGPPPSPTHVVNHRDLDRANNALSNLEWVTKSQDISHAFQAGGRTHRGERGPNARLTEADVAAIRRRYRPRVPGRTHADLAAEFGVAVSTVRHVVSGHSWTHVA